MNTKNTEKAKIHWVAQAAYTAYVDGGEKRLGIVVQPSPNGEEWFVAAFEMPREATTVEAVLDDHAHKVVGSYASEGKAFLAGESFAAAWLRKFKAASFEACGCGEIRETDGKHSSRVRRRCS